MSNAQKKDRARMVNAVGGQTPRGMKLGKAIKSAQMLANARVHAPAMKTTTDVPQPRINTFVRSRFNPLRMLTPELLSYYLDNFKVGFIKYLALVWDSIEDRDDMVKTVKPKREKAISRYAFQVVFVDNLDDSLKTQAEDQKEKVEYFYHHLEVTNAIDENEKRGFKQLVRQMMDAVGKKYAVHEIVWRPQPDGNLTAQFRFTPLWFFENTKGSLKYLPSEGQIYGDDLDEAGWMVTVGDGLMFATCIAYMFKNMTLKDWVGYCERCGAPGFIGRTDAPAGSAQWNAVMNCVQELASNFSAVLNNDDGIEVLDLKGAQAALPYQSLVDRMDRAIAALWRGGDLSTMSSGQHSQGHGSNRQQEESDLIEEDDIAMIEETLERNVTKYVIEYLFGDDTPLVKLKIIKPPEQDVAQDIDIDNAMLSWGAPLGMEAAYARYGRTPPSKGEPILTAPAAPEQPLAVTNAAARGRRALRQNRAQQDAELLANAHQMLTAGQAALLKPFQQRLVAAYKSPAGELAPALKAVQADMPALLKAMNLDPVTAQILTNSYTAAFFNEVATQPSKS